MGRITLAVIEHVDGDIFVGSATYCTHNSDTPANTLFEDCIIDLEYERAISYPYWSRTRTTTPVRFLDLVNITARFDSLILSEWRDTVIKVYAVEPRAAFSTAELVAYMLVDTVDTPDPGTFRINAYSYLEVIDKEITTRYDNTVSNEQLRNKPKPIALGLVRWVYPQNFRLNEPSTSVRGAYDVADGYFEDIVTLRERGALETEAGTYLVTNASPKYFVSGGYNTALTLECYGFLYREQEYRLAPEVRGQIRRISSIMLNNDFADDNGGYPDQFTIVEGSGAIAWVSSGVVTFSSPGADDVYIYQTFSLLGGYVYHIEMDITSLTGVLSVLKNGASIQDFDSIGGRYFVSFYQSSNASVTVGVGFLTGASGSATLASFSCTSAKRIDCLSEISRFIVNRTGMDAANWDFTACEAYDGVKLAFSSTDEVNGLRLLELASQSLNVCIYQNRFGVLVPVKLEDPSGLSADFTILETDVDGVVTFTPDLAPGLATRINYDLNYNVHSVDDIEGLPAATTGNAATRADLQRTYKTATSTLTPHTTYVDAAEREPLDTLLSDSGDAQDVVDHPVDLYADVRGFYTLRARTVSNTEPYTIEPGDVVNLYYWRYGLSAGKKLFVVYAKSSFLRNVVDLVLWG